MNALDNKINDMLAGNSTINIYSILCLRHLNMFTLNLFLFSYDNEYPRRTAWEILYERIVMLISWKHKIITRDGLLMLDLFWGTFYLVGSVPLRERKLSISSLVWTGSMMLNFFTKNRSYTNEINIAIIFQNKHFLY